MADTVSIENQKPETEINFDDPQDAKYELIEKDCEEMDNKLLDVGRKWRLVWFGNKKKFSLKDLLNADWEPVKKGVIKLGMYGTTYRPVGLNKVVVKSLRSVILSRKEFNDIIQVLGLLTHPYVLPLKAYAYSSYMEYRTLLVYDYIGIGSLESLLHDIEHRRLKFPKEENVLSWRSRLQIAATAANGIEFFHSHGPSFVHGNIKSSSSLVSKNCTALVTEFGLCQFAGRIPAPLEHLGFQAPEVYIPSEILQEADVYSFGVLLLELLTGKAPIHPGWNERGEDLAETIPLVPKEEWKELFDRNLSLVNEELEEMKVLLDMAIRCVVKSPELRPSMSTVSSEIQELYNTLRRRMTQ